MVAQAAAARDRGQDQMAGHARGHVGDVPNGDPMHGFVGERPRRTTDAQLAFARASSRCARAMGTIDTITSTTATTFTIGA